MNATQGDGATALHWAVYWDDHKTAELLIRAGADVDAANAYEVTPLWLACANASGADGGTAAGGWRRCEGDPDDR